MDVAKKLTVRTFVCLGFRQIDTALGTFHHLTWAFFLHARLFDQTAPFRDQRKNDTQHHYYNKNTQQRQTP